MSAYYGIVRSVIRRGYDAYQVTFTVHGIGDGERAHTDRDKGDFGDVLVFRADVAVEAGKCILFPDRELGRYLQLFRDSSDVILSGIGREDQRNVGRIADRICMEMTELLLSRQYCRMAS